MTATRADIQGWLMEGQKRGATHVVIACDRFDYDNYPVYVMPGEDVLAAVHNHTSGENMQSVDEVYALHLDIEAQLGEHRAFHTESPPTRREPLIVQTPTVLSRVLKQVRAEDAERLTLAKKVVALVESEPWITAAAISKRLKAKSGSVSSILVRLTADDGPFIREKRGPRGGYGYAMRPGPRKSRYDLLNLEDWL